jgi:hypothetical protein
LPQQWKESIIVSIYKKGDKTGCNNYRGISLTQVYAVLSHRSFLWMTEPDVLMVLFDPGLSALFVCFFLSFFLSSYQLPTKFYLTFFWPG